MPRVPVERESSLRNTRYSLRLTPYGHEWLVSRRESPATIIEYISTGLWKLKTAKYKSTDIPEIEKSVVFGLRLTSHAKKWSTSQTYMGKKLRLADMVNLLALGIWKVETGNGDCL